MVKINFENTYQLLTVAEDLTFATFNTVLKNGETLLLKIAITPHHDPLLPAIYNLAFGPIDTNGEMNDQIKIHHSNLEKTFSTVLLIASVFLKQNSNLLIGIDGTNDARAYLYHRILISNRGYFDQFFITIGIDWYVRLLRDGYMELDQEESPYFKPKPELFDYQRPCKDLYRYYALRIKP